MHRKIGRKNQYFHFTAILVDRSFFYDDAEFYLYLYCSHTSTERRNLLKINAFILQTFQCQKARQYYCYLLHKKQKHIFYICFYLAIVNHNLEYYDQDHVWKRRVRSAPSVKLDCWNILFYYLNRFHGCAIENSLGFFFTVLFSIFFFEFPQTISSNTVWLFCVLLCADWRENFEFH